jgi:hypothetical protein
MWLRSHQRAPGSANSVSCGDARRTRVAKVTGLLVWIILRMFALSVSFIERLAGIGDGGAGFEIGQDCGRIVDVTGVLGFHEAQARRAHFAGVS